MAILYGIKKVVLTELDPTTGKPPVGSDGVVCEISTAEEATLTPVLSEGSEEILRSYEKILAVVKTDDLLYGYDITYKDNSFDEKVAGLVAGYKVTYDSVETTKVKTIATPMMEEGFLGKPFKIEMYIPNYKGTAIINYAKISLNYCIGKFPEMKIGKEFYAPEFEVKARENTAAKLPIKSVEFVDSI